MSRYWFRQKRFGYGATPNSWQGWLLTLLSVALALGVVVAANFMHDAARLFVLAVGLPLVLVPTVLVSHAKTEGGWRWRWGQHD
jgi:hypothetical protein